MDVGHGTPWRVDPAGSASEETDSDSLKDLGHPHALARPRGRCFCRHASLMAALLLLLLGTLERQTTLPPKRGHIRLQGSPGSWHVSHCAHMWVPTHAFAYECTLCACVCTHMYTV